MANLFLDVDDIFGRGRHPTPGRADSALRLQIAWLDFIGLPYSTTCDAIAAHRLLRAFSCRWLLFRPPLTRSGNWSSRCCFDSVHPMPLSILVNSVTLNATNQNNVRCSNFRAVSIKEVEVKMDSEADVEAVKLVAEGKNCWGRVRGKEDLSLVQILVHYLKGKAALPFLLAFSEVSPYGTYCSL